jgi:hypothetical protein
MPNEKDFAVNAVGQFGGSVPGAIQATNLGGSPISKKPSYLLTLLSTGAKTKELRFIAIDKPEFLPNCVQVKGVYLDESEDKIINNVSGILTSIKKELVLEMTFPWHRICSIRSLVFNAVKTQTLVR